MGIIGLAILTFIASSIGTLTGFGTSTVMIPVLATAFPSPEMLLLVAIIHWFGDIWKIFFFRTGFNKQLFLLFGILGLPATYLGAQLSLYTNHTLFLTLLGIFLCSYAVLVLTRLTPTIPVGTMYATLGGALSGFFAGLFGIGGPTRAAFLSAFDLPKTAYLVTIGAIGVVIDVVRIVVYFLGGANLTPTLWWSLLLLIPVSFIGAQVAHHIVHKIPQKKFRTIVAFFIFIVGLKLIIFPN